MKRSIRCVHGRGWDGYRVFHEMIQSCRGRFRTMPVLLQCFVRFPQGPPRAGLWPSVQTNWAPDADAWSPLLLPMTCPPTRSRQIHPGQTLCNLISAKMSSSLISPFSSPNVNPAWDWEHLILRLLGFLSGIAFPKGRGLARKFWPIFTK